MYCILLYFSFDYFKAGEGQKFNEKFGNWNYKYGAKNLLDCVFYKRLKEFDNI